MNFFKKIFWVQYDIQEINNESKIINDNKQEFIDTLTMCVQSDKDITIKKPFKLTPYHENAFKFRFTSFKEFNDIRWNIDNIIYSPHDIEYSYNRYYIIERKGKDIKIQLGD